MLDECHGLVSLQHITACDDLQASFSSWCMTKWIETSHNDEEFLQGAGDAFQTGVPALMSINLELVGHACFPDQDLAPRVTFCPFFCNVE